MTGARLALRPAGLMLGLGLLSFSVSATPPSADEVNRVVDYFNTGKGQGPVLLEMTPCLEIGKPAGERKKKCIKPITAAVRTGTTAYVYLRWVVPRDDKYDDIVVEWLRGDDVEASTQISVSTSWSYGIWKAKGLTKSGSWTVRVRRGEQVLGESQIVVE